jgi:ribosomal protein S18 acetylase RimI-like enzyme
MKKLIYKRLDTTELTVIKKLWEELNLIHLVDSIYFKEHYASFSFTERSRNWLKLPEDNFHLLVAETKDSVPVGYCVSTIDVNWKGEIDSLFVSTEYRQKGVGQLLVRKSMKWLNDRRCISIRLSVSYGREKVLGFYQKLGFYPRLTTLELKNNHTHKY